MLDIHLVLGELVLNLLHESLLSLNILLESCGRIILLEEDLVSDLIAVELAGDRLLDVWCEDASGDEEPEATCVCDKVKNVEGSVDAHGAGEGSKVRKEVCSLAQLHQNGSSKLVLVPNPPHFLIDLDHIIEHEDDGPETVEVVVPRHTVVRSASLHVIEHFVRALDSDILVLELHWLDLVSLGRELESILHVVLVQLKVDHVRLLVAPLVSIPFERFNSIIKAVEIWLVHGQCDWSVTTCLGNLKDDTIHVTVSFGHVII